MIEFSLRTHQPDREALARDYEPPVIDVAATPIRVREATRGGSARISRGGHRLGRRAARRTSRHSIQRRRSPARVLDLPAADDKSYVVSVGLPVAPDEARRLQHRATCRRPLNPHPSPGCVVLRQTRGNRRSVGIRCDGCDRCARCDGCGAVHGCTGARVRQVRQVPCARVRGCAGAGCTGQLQGAPQVHLCTCARRTCAPVHRTAPAALQRTCRTCRTRSQPHSMRLPLRPQRHQSVEEAGDSLASLTDCASPPPRRAGDWHSLQSHTPCRSRPSGSRYGRSPRGRGLDRCAWRDAESWGQSHWAAAPLRCRCHTASGS